MKQIAGVLAVGLFSAGLAQAQVVVAGANEPVVPGQWHSNLTAAKAKAAELGAPLLVAWGDPGCSYSTEFGKILGDAAVQQYFTERGLVMVFELSGASAGTPVRQWVGTGAEWPLLRLSWDGEGVDTGRGGWLRPNKSPNKSKPAPVLASMQSKIESLVGDFVPVPPDPSRDSKDPANDTIGGATELTWSGQAKSLALKLAVRTEAPAYADTEDWFTFTALSGVTYRVWFTDVGGIAADDPQTAVFSDESQTLVYDGGVKPLAGNPSFEFTPPENSDIYVKVWRATASDTNITYKLNYQRVSGGGGDGASEWFTNMSAAKARAAELGAPLLVMWGDPGCSYSTEFWKILDDAAVSAYLNDLGFVLVKELSGAGAGTPVRQWVGTGAEWPLLRLSWDDGSVDTGRGGWLRPNKTPNKSKPGPVLIALQTKILSLVGDYEPSAGGGTNPPTPPVPLDNSKDKYDPANDAVPVALEWSDSVTSEDLTLAKNAEYTDTDDRFTLNVVSGATYKIWFSGVSGISGDNPQVEIRTNGAVFATQSLTGTAVHEFTATANGAITLRIWRATTSDTDIAYTLNYQRFAPGRLEFAATAVSVAATNATSVTLTVQRTGGTTGAATVQIGYGDSATSGHTATAGEDFNGTPSPATLTWADGETGGKTVTFPIIRHAAEPETNKTFGVTLTSTTGNAVGADATVSILFSPTRIEFVQLAYTQSESAASVQVQVRRTGALTGAAAVQLGYEDSATSGHTATAGEDFNGTPSPATLTWADGESGQKTATFTLIKNAVQVEGSETFAVTLTATTPGTATGPDAVVTLTEADPISAAAPPARYTGWVGSGAVEGTFALTVSAAGRVTGKAIFPSKAPAGFKGTYTVRSGAYTDVDIPSGVVTLTALLAKGSEQQTAVLEIDPATGAVQGVFGEGAAQRPVTLFRLGGVPAALAGAYTAAFPAVSGDPADSAPAGSGYATFTVAAKGTFRAAGKLGDGTSYSQSGELFVIPGSSEPRFGAVLYTAPTAYQGGLFSGAVVFGDANTNGVTDISFGLPIFWISHKPDAVSEYGTGFQVLCGVTGGRHDKTKTLATTYPAGTEFSIGGFSQPVGLPFTLAEIVAGGRTVRGTAWATNVHWQAAQPLELGVNAAGTGFTVHGGDLAQTGVDGTTGQKLYNYDTAVNPDNVRVTWTRATGLLKGSFSIYYDYPTQLDTREEPALQQKWVHTAKTVQYAGVLLQERADSGDTAGFGYFLVSGKAPNGSRLYSFKQSGGFAVKAEVDAP